MLDDLHVLIVIRKGKRHCTQHPLINFVSSYNLSASHRAFIAKLNSIDIPKIVQEALGMRIGGSQCKRRWVTWKILGRLKIFPLGRKSRNKLGIKYKVNGTLERYKARLVVKGYTQTYEIDYQTFTLVAKMNTICFLLSLATNFD